MCCSIVPNFPFCILGEIRVTRTNSLGIANVRWGAFNFMENLEETSGIITFPANEDSTMLRLRLKQDDVSLSFLLTYVLGLLFLQFLDVCPAKFR